MWTRQALLEKMHTPVTAPGARVSFEFFPPKTPKAQAGLWKAAQELAGFSPDFVSVTYGAGGTTREGTRDIVTKMKKDLGLTAAAHLTCVSATKEEIDAIAREYWEAGIHRLVALRGDPPEGVGAKYTPHPGGYAYADSLVAGLKKIAPFDISVAGYPETHPQALSAAADMDHLKRKADAGADRIITQFFMDPDLFLRYRDRVADMGITIPVVAGVIVINNFPKLCEFAARCGAAIPAWLHAMFAETGEDPAAQMELAQAFLIAQCRILAQAGVREFHFYTLNRSELAAGACRALGLAVSEQARDAARA